MFFKAILQTLDLDKYFLASLWHNNVLETLRGAIPHGNDCVTRPSGAIFVKITKDHGQDTYQSFSNLLEYNL
jgi:hypothetical protein